MSRPSHPGPKAGAAPLLKRGSASSYGREGGGASSRGSSGSTPRVVGGGGSGGSRRGFGGGAASGAGAPVGDPLSVESALKLVDRPRVTCRAWGVADPDTGEFLLGHRESHARQIASITKVMTAHLVYVAADQEPELMDELVLVSPEAAAVGGTTAKLRVGEVYTVADLLYGMMLPSGNDAAAALAEYLGDSYDAPNDYRSRAGVELHPWTRFVAEMNREARRLGLKSTSFGNCHGLQSAQLKSTAEDVARMCTVVMRRKSFRKVVNTPVYKARARVLRKAAVHGSYSRPRNYPYVNTWTNTNTLLGSTARAKLVTEHDGMPAPMATFVYDGVKTGITRPAGGCLVTRLTRVDEGVGERAGKDAAAGTMVSGFAPQRKHLLIVVLGAEGSTERFSDTERVAKYALTVLRQ